MAGFDPGRDELSGQKKSPGFSSFSVYSGFLVYE